LVTNKRELNCEMVILTAGVGPAVELAKEMGLEIGPSRGIRTDDYMMTSEEDIYACGDCVESKDIITGETGLSLLWPNAKRQGWISGCNCAGERRRFTGSFNLTAVEIFGAYAVSVGLGAVGTKNQDNYQSVEEVRGSSFYRLILRNDRLIGMQLINKSEHAGRLFSKMLRKDDLTELAREVLCGKRLSIRPWNYWISGYDVLAKTASG